MAENVDLAKTFTAIAGTTLPRDGHSLMALMQGQGRGLAKRDPGRAPRRSACPRSTRDFQQPASGNPTTYEAMRTPAFLYVEYADGEREFYDLGTTRSSSTTSPGRSSRPSSRGSTPSSSGSSIATAGREVLGGDARRAGARIARNT